MRGHDPARGHSCLPVSIPCVPWKTVPKPGLWPPVDALSSPVALGNPVLPLLSPGSSAVSVGGEETSLYPQGFLPGLLIK